MPTYRFTVTEYDPGKPWLIVSTRLGLTVELEHDRHFTDWAAKAWPGQRFKAVLDAGQRGPICLGYINRSTCCGGLGFSAPTVLDQDPSSQDGDHDDADADYVPVGRGSRAPGDGDRQVQGAVTSEVRPASEDTL